jgi:hypothetical protein
MDSQPERVPMVKLASITQPSAAPAPAPAPAPASVPSGGEAAIPDHIMAMQTHFKEVKVNLPPINFRELNGYADKEKKYKAELKTQLIVEHISQALRMYTEQETKYNTEIVLFVCQAVEDLISASKAGALKKDMVVRICAPYFDGKAELVDMVIKLVFDRVIKTNMVRRNRMKLARLSWYVAKNTIGAMFQSVISKPL